MAPNPLAGLSKNQKILFIGGGVVVIGFTVYRYQKQKSADAATAAANTAATTQGTGAGSSDQIDPATGFPYGSAEDASALTAQAGYNSPIAGLGYNDTSYLYAQSGYPQSGGFTNNSQWAQAAEAYLVNTGGADANTVGNALGKYITGGTMTDESMTSVINQAIAFEGYPPVAGPDGYPPSIRMAPVTPAPVPTPTPTPTPIPTTIVPNLIGKTKGEAHNILESDGLIPFDADWTHGVNATKKVVRQSPKAGTSVQTHSKVSFWS